MKAKSLKVVVAGVTLLEAEKIAAIDEDGFSGWQRADDAFVATWNGEVWSGAKDSDIQQEWADEIAHELGRDVNVTFDDVTFRTGRLATPVWGVEDVDGLEYPSSRLVATTDKKVSNPLEGLVVTRGAGGRDRVMRVSGDREVFLPGKSDSVGKVATAFVEFEGTSLEVTEWLREFANRQTA